MTVEHEERVQVIQDGGYAREKRIVEVKPETRSVVVHRITEFMKWVIAFILIIITLRFGFKLIGANATNVFVGFLYGLTDIFILPFAGIVNSPTFGTNSIFDTASLFGLIAYSLGGWGLIVLFRILFAGTQGTRRVSTFERQS
jgi:uncharacterized membrane protein